jgi:Ca2+-binding EF-hand superfamily protein
MDPNSDPYEVDPKIKADFTPDKFTEYLRVFKCLDINKNGSISKEEIIKGMFVYYNQYF